MSWVAAAAVGGAVVSGAIASDAAGKASDAQVGAANRSVESQRTQDRQTRIDNAPFMRTGVAANKRLAQLLGIDAGDGPVEWQGQQYKSADELRRLLKEDYARQTGHQSFGANDEAIESIISQARKLPSADQSQDPEYGSLTRRFAASDLEADPVYQSGLKFGLDRGTEGINARATAGGMFDSGATLKALTQFGNDYGSTKANESFNRFNSTNDSIYNKLAGVSGAGQVATGQVAASGANMANNVSNSIEGAGNARAAGIVGGANAWGGAAGGINNALNNYQSNQTLQALLRRNGGGMPTSNFDYTGYTAAGGNQYG